MFQDDETSLKQDLTLVAAIAAAGFKLTDSKSVPTDDGVCWRATLAYGRTKIVTVSNGGFGGPDETYFHATSDVDKVYLAKLFAVPEVITAVRGHMVDSLKLNQMFNKVSEADFEAAKADIAVSLPTPTEDNIEFLVGRIADIAGMVTKLKRALKTKVLVVFEGDDAQGAYTEYKMADTPANRERLKQHVNRKIDYFVADLLGSTNPGSAA